MRWGLQGIFVACALLGVAPAAAHAGVAVGVTDSVDPLTAGEPGSFVVTVTGTAGGATGVSFELTVPIGLQSTSFSPSGGVLCRVTNAPSTSTYRCTAPDLAEGSQASLTYRYSAAPDVAEGSTATASARAAATGDTATTGDNVDAETTTLQRPRTDLRPIFGFAPTAVAGTVRTVSLGIQNLSARRSDAARVTLPLPAGVTYAGKAFENLSCTTPAVGAGGTISCTASGVDANSASTVDVDLRFSPDAPATVLTTATVSQLYDTATGNDATTGSTAVARQADLAVAVTGPASGLAGDALAYDVTVSSAGPSTAEEVALDVRVPAGATLESLTQTSGPALTCAATGCGGGTLQPGQSAVVRALVRRADAGAVDLTATASSTATDAAPANDTATVSTAVVARPPQDPPPGTGTGGGDPPPPATAGPPPPASTGGSGTAAPPAARCAPRRFRAPAAVRRARLRSPRGRSLPRRVRRTGRVVLADLCGLPKGTYRLEVVVRGRDGRLRTTVRRLVVR